MFALFCDYKFLKSGTEKNKPYQQYLNMGVFEVVESYFTVNGQKNIHPKPVITPKGQQYLIKWFKENLIDNGIFTQILEDSKNYNKKVA
jgi:phage antirepressor YoqD-like protein